MNSLAHTDALIPKWVVYDDIQKRAFVSPQKVEADFVRQTGTIHISIDYVNSLNFFLDRIHKTILNAKYGGNRIQNHNIKIEIVNIQLACQVPKRAFLSLIEVRPCAEGLGIFKLILWQLLQSCKCVGWDCAVSVPFPKTRQLIRRVANELFVNEGSNMVISLENISKCSIDNFEILDKLIFSEHDSPYMLTLNPKSFPQADVMNVHQDQLDARMHQFKPPISEKKRMRLLSDMSDGMRVPPPIDRSLMPALENPCRVEDSHKNYFHGFLRFLHDIRRKFKECGKMYKTPYIMDFNSSFRCRVAQCRIFFDHDAAAILQVLDIFEGLDIQNLILWQILQCCYDAGLDFKMGLTVVRGETMRRIGMFTRLDKFWFISRNDIERLSIENFDILDKIYGYSDDHPCSIDPLESRFPTEDDLYRAQEEKNALLAQEQQALQMRRERNALRKRMIQEQAPARMVIRQRRLGRPCLPDLPPDAGPEACRGTGRPVSF